MPPAKFKYTAHIHEDHIIVSILLIDPEGGHRSEVGSLIFNDPSDERGYLFQYYYWKETMHWGSRHVFIEEVREERDEKAKRPSDGI